MFTGLVEELGTLAKVRKEQESMFLTIKAQQVLEELKIGDSIAVNGACLTVVEYNDESFRVEVMPETYQKTNLKLLKLGEKVNLERALKFSDRLGGHLVSGHIDDVGRIIDIVPRGIAKIYSIQLSRDFLKYLVSKGSVAIDGISLTIVEVKDNFFTVSLIPHTGQVTTLGLKNKGDWVNIEIDILSKYVEKLLNHPKKDNLNLSFLAENGFL